MPSCYDMNEGDAASAINSVDITTDTSPQSSRLEQAKVLAKDDKLLSAARLLKGIDNCHFEPIHHHILREAEIFQALLDESTDHHTSNANNHHDEWIKQGESHGRHDFCIYYKISSTNQLTCRIETPIFPSLLVPLLSVLNESELYSTWIPSFKFPKFAVVKSEKLRQSGRCEQVIVVETEVQYPLGSRQLLLKAVACDDIDVHPEENTEQNNDCRRTNEPINGGATPGGGRILVRIQSLDDETESDREELEGLEIPPTKRGYVRMDVKGGFIFEKCPHDHPMALYSSAAGVEREVEELVLVTFSFAVDPKLSIIPKSFINFFLRVAMGHLWGMFLKVADEVREGKRPVHSEVIERKRGLLYGWIEERTRVMLSRDTPESSP